MSITGSPAPRTESGLRQARGSVFFFPLSPGFIESPYVAYLSYYTKGTPYGPLNPINASKYRRLSFRSSMLQSARDWVECIWSTEYAKNPSGADAVTFYDGELTYSAAGGYTYQGSPSGYRLYDVDLANANWNDQRKAEFPWTKNFRGAAWGGTVYSFPDPAFDQAGIPHRQLRLDQVL